MYSEWFFSNDCGMKNLHLFSVCILSIFVLSAICKSLPSCPPGQIQYETTDSNHICCVPIIAPYYCGIHFRVQRCIKDGEPDTCVECEHGLVKFSNSTSGAEEDRCYRPIRCPEEASLSKTGQCECDQSRCYYGDQFACTYFSSKCRENMYHKNGACVPCAEGTHRPGIGCGPCQTMSSPASSVKNVSMPNSNLVNSPTNVPTEAPTKSPMPDLTHTENGIVPEVDEAVDSGSLSGFPHWAMIVLIVLVALILIVLIFLGTVWFIRKRKPKGHVRVPSNPSTLHDNTDSDGLPHPALPPSYSQSLINQIHQNTGYCNGDTHERCNNQTAKPFQNSRYDPPSEHPASGASQSFEPAQPSSTSSIDLPPTGFSSRSSGPPDRVSTPGEAPDQTYVKVAAGGGESIREQHRLLIKPTSGVVPVDDDDDDDDGGVLLRSAPSLDPDSIQQDRQ